jgi:glutamate transport system substrate-binding protein
MTGAPSAQRRPARPWLRRCGAALAAAAATAVLASCGINNGPSSVAHKSTLVIGVKADQPGLGLEKDGTFQGFDVDVASYVAKRLGATKVEFKAITSDEREKWLRDGTVDLVVATYSITPVRKTQVLFAGPYYLAHQDTLILSSEAGAIRNVHDLKGKTLCNVSGSNSYNPGRRGEEDRRRPGVRQYLQGLRGQARGRRAPGGLHRRPDPRGLRT